MKKLERIKLSKLSEEFVPMSSEQLDRIKGGEYTDPTTGTTFHSSAEVSAMQDAGTWDGGWIAGVGYAGADADLSTMNLSSEMGASDISSAFDSIAGEAGSDFDWGGYSGYSDSWMGDMLDLYGCSFTSGGSGGLGQHSLTMGEFTVSGSSGYEWDMTQCETCAKAFYQINNDYNANARADGLKYIMNTVAHYCGLH